MRGYHFCWIAVLGFAGCLSAEPPQSELGQLSFPLIADGVSGMQYRFTGSFKVTDTTSGEMTTIPAEGGGDAVLIHTAPGTYQIEVEDGWQVAVIDTDGTETPVEAVVLTELPAPVIVRPGRISEVTLRFGVGSERVAFGKGGLDIGVEVVDTMIAYEFEGTVDGTGYLWGRIAYVPSLFDQRPNPRVGLYQVAPANGIFEAEIYITGPIDYYFTLTLPANDLAEIVVGSAQAYGGAEPDWIDMFRVSSPIYYTSDGQDLGASFSVSLIADQRVFESDGLPRTDFFDPTVFTQTSFSLDDGTTTHTGTVESFRLLPTPPMTVP